MGLAKLFVVLAVCVTSAASFFDFLKSAPKLVEQHLDTNLVRGAPEYLHSKYTKDPFVCDGKAQSLSIVNDGFCDCIDKSDEPGTSACQGTVFHCINKGYKMIKIPSSRVDDQVCDCCDGSDEGRVTNCPNKCDEVAQSERAQLIKVTADYKIGSAVRENLIKTVRAEKAQLTASVTPLGMEIHGLQRNSEELQAQIDRADSKVKSLEDSVAREQRRLVRTELQMESLTFAQLSQLMSNLLKVLGIEGNTVADLIKNTPSTSRADFNPPAEEEEHAGDEEDDITVPDLPEVDEYGDVIAPEHDLDAVADNTVAAGDSSTVVDAQAEESCDVVTHSGDFGLVSLCDVVTSAESALDTVTSLVIKRTAYNEVSLLLAHFHAHGTFTDAHSFVRSHLDSDAAATCPASFESAPAVAGQAHLCSVRESLPVAIAGLEAHFGLVAARADLSTLRSGSNEIKNKISEVERRLRTAQGANDELVKHANELEYLAMKDQCFEKEDGAFTYTLCVLGAITQKEVVGHRSVTLGTHESIEVLPDDAAAVSGVVPSALLKYGGGQHCHAFGARTATVTVSCAAQNALISATEPSTCAYRLHFESPAACTPRYAQLAGIATQTLV